MVVSSTASRMLIVWKPTFGALFAARRSDRGKEHPIVVHELHAQGARLATRHDVVANDLPLVLDAPMPLQRAAVFLRAFGTAFAQCNAIHTQLAPAQ